MGIAEIRQNLDKFMANSILFCGVITAFLSKFICNYIVPSFLFAAFATSPPENK